MTSFDAKTQKSFDFAADTTKQLITLSTAILALTITFVKDLVGPVAGWPRAALGIAWILYVLSIMFGLVALMSLTGELQPKLSSLKDEEGRASATEGNRPPAANAANIRSRDIVFSSAFQIICFTVATIAFVVFGFASY